MHREKKNVCNLEHGLNPIVVEIQNDPKCLLLSFQSHNPSPSDTNFEIIDAL
jgi:hypothetical protein